MKKSILLLTAFVCATFAFGETFTVKSPNGKIAAQISDGKELALTISAEGTMLIDGAKIGMDTDRGFLGKDARAKASAIESRDETIEPAYGIRAEIPDVCNVLTLEFKNFNLQVRAYDDSVAYRFISKLGDGKMIVKDELLDLNAKGGDKIIAHAVKGDQTSFEEFFLRLDASELAKHHSATIPLLLKKGEKTVAVVESDLKSFPGLRFVWKDGLKASHSKYPKSFKEIGRNITVASTEDFIAKTDASRKFPWRVFVIADKDSDLAVNDTVFKLASPSKIDDTDWISTGTCVWDWWNNWHLEGVNFKPGINDETYRYYVDFAADNMIPYILVDEGWVADSFGSKVKSDHSRVDQNLVDGKTTFNVPEIIEYAHSKDVKVVLWVLGKTIDKLGKPSMDKMKSWGADGVKVDFFDRDDQLCVELYENIAKLAAEREMIVDFHGCQPPVGLQRTYPNVVNFEGVRGNEQFKWSVLPTSHQVDIVYTRMLLGQMDFTPGAMRNFTDKEFKPNGGRPGAIGTRAAQMAQYILYYGPLQMLCDSPSEYKKCPDVLRFIAHAPTTWDDSKAIDGKIGEFAVIARCKDDNWYIGGINSGKAREVEIDFSEFLDKDATAKAEIFRDTKNSENTATDYKHEVVEISGKGKMKIVMEKDGGFAIKITPKKFSVFGIDLF